MRHFCTLFDSGFLSRGLVLHDSLVATGTDFHLAIFAFDEGAEKILRDLALPRVTVIGLSEFEDPGLLAVKASRTRGEYCWTSTPSTILYCLTTLGWPEATYLDADLCFYSDPDVLFEEMGSASVLLTSHNYARQYDQSRKSGTYCVQFMRFVADERGLKALVWWRDRCLEWCFNRREAGRFGDQFYLEDWTSRFDGVHVLAHQGGGLAPWNIRKYQLVFKGESWSVSLGSQTWKPVFYHFHGVRFYEDDFVGYDNYYLGPGVVRAVYHPYVRRLLAQTKMLQARYPEIDWVRAQPLPKGWKRHVSFFKNTFFRTWYFFSTKEL